MKRLLAPVLALLLAAAPAWAQQPPVGYQAAPGPGPAPGMAPDGSNASLSAAGRAALGLGAAVPVGVLASAAGTVTAAGTGYVPGERVVLAGGTATTQAAVIIVDTQAVSGTVAAAGSGGSNGACTVTGTTGTGTKAQFTGTVSGGALTGPLTIAVAGDYTVNPTAIAAEPVTGCSLVGAQVNMTMGALGYWIQSPGSYTVAPTNPAQQGSTSGSGTGATFTLSYGTFAADYLNSSGILGGAGKTNFRLGYSAGISITTGAENTFVGNYTGASISTGGFNSAFGHNALGIGGGGGCLNLAGSSNAAFGADALRNYCGNAGGNGNTAIGVGAMSTLAHATAALNTAVGNNAMDRFNPSNNNKFYNTAIGYHSCRGATGGNFDFGHCFGAETGSALTSASKFVLVGQGTGNTTFASGSDVMLLDTGNNALDTPAAGSSNMLNITKTIAGDTNGATNPMVCGVGMKCVIGVLRGANANVTTDQPITIRPLTSTDTGFVAKATKYLITDIYITNCSASPGTAAGGFYTGASKTGTIIGATTTTFTNCTSATTAHRLTGLTNQDTTIFNAATLFLSLTTTKGSAGTFDVYVIAELVN